MFKRSTSWLLLHLEASRSSSTSTSLKLSSNRLDSGSLTLVRTHAEVSDSLSRVSRTSQDQSVLTLGGSSSKLIQSDGLTTSLQDLSLSTGSESESGNSSLGELKDSVVVSDSANNNNGLVSSTLLAKSSRNSRNRHRGSVNLGEEKLLENDLVERRVGSSSQKSVQLDQELQVDIVRLRSSSVTTSNMRLRILLDTHG